MMTERAWRLEEVADHYWYLAERAEAEGRTADVVEGLQHRAVVAKIAAEIEKRRSAK
ncbi:MAG TPA: hypothetical protein VIG24_13735 [Acidimicrobiia bacterium]